MPDSCTIGHRMCLITAGIGISTSNLASQTLKVFIDGFSMDGLNSVQNSTRMEF